METEDFLIEKYGLCPSQEFAAEIRQLLREEIQNHEESGCGEYLRVLCFMLFYLGNVEDCELIWQAKMLNMDTGCMIDVGLLCGAGYNATIDYVSNNRHLQEMKSYIMKCLTCGDEFGREAIIADFKEYYHCYE